MIQVAAKKAVVKKAAKKTVVKKAVVKKVAAKKATTKRALKTKPVAPAVVAPPPAVVVPTPEPPKPAPNLPRAEDFSFSDYTYAGCCGARIAYNWHPKPAVRRDNKTVYLDWTQPFTQEFIDGMIKRFEAVGYNLSGITNQTQQIAARVLEACGWTLATRMGGNYGNNELKFWVYVPKKRRI